MRNIWLVTLVGGPHCGETREVDGSATEPGREIVVPVGVPATASSAAAWLVPEGATIPSELRDSYRLERVGEGKTAVFLYQGRN